MSSQDHPEIIKYVTNWCKEYEGRVFDFANESDQDLFLTALTDLGRHLAHTTRKVKIYTIGGKNGLSTVYLNIEN